MNKEDHINEMADKALNNILSLCQECEDTDVMEKVLSMSVVGSVAILRGLKGDKFINDFLISAIKDTANKITVEQIKLN